MTTYQDKQIWLSFGDYLMFNHLLKNHNGDILKRSNPVVALFVMDNTTYGIKTNRYGFYYLPWPKNCKAYTPEVMRITEGETYNEYVDIIKVWTHKPSMKEMLHYYRRALTINY